MRAFLLACVAVVIIGAGGYYVLASLQEPSGLAFTTHAARIDPDWSWRAVTTASPAQSCEPRKSSQWFFVDFRDPSGEPGLCSYSQ
jgi:hypothetical protein